MADKRTKHSLPDPKVLTDNINAQKDKAAKSRFPLHLKFALVLGLISLLVYANTLKNGFAMDDFSSIRENSIVTKGVSAIPEILSTPYRRGFFHTANDLYRPLSLVMFATEYQLFGLNPMVNHLFNVLLYAGCVILLFTFLDNLTERKKTVVAFIAALLFALHPVHTEVVANIKSRDELLCFFFAFLSLNLFINYMRSGKITGLITGAFCFLLSIFSKETTITFLAVIPFVFFFFCNENKKRSAHITLSALVVSIIFLAARYSVLNFYHANETANILFIDNALTQPHLPFDSRIATALLIMGNYIRLLFVPYPLICDYSYSSIPIINFSSPLALLSLVAYVFLIVAGIKLFIKNTKSLFAFAIIFFLITLSLFSNIPFLIGAAMGERFLFFPSVGFSLFAALAIEKWVVRKDMVYPAFLKNIYALAALLPVCLLYGGLTIARNYDWKDDLTLFKTDLLKSPENCRLNEYYGKEMVKNILTVEKDSVRQREVILEAIPYIKKAIEIYPDYTDAYSDLGWAYSQALNYDSAEVYIIQALQKSPASTIAINNLSKVYNDKATVYNSTGNFPQAIAYSKKAIVLNPYFVKAHYNLGCYYRQTGKNDSAIYHLNMALTLDPKFPDANMQSGLLYFSTQKYDDAERCFKKEAVIDPKNVNPVNNLGAVYLQTGKNAAALEEFRKAIALSPNDFHAYSNMGFCYQLLHKYDSAIYFLNKAISLGPVDKASYQTLAATYQLTGNLDSAKKYQDIVNTK